MAAVNKGPIGVWSSIALVILVLGAFAGRVLGSAVARYSYRHHQEQQGTLSRSEQVHLDSELAELNAIQMEMLYELFALEKIKPPDKVLLDEIMRLEDLDRRSNLPEIKPVIELRMGLAYVRASMTNEENHQEEQARQNMQSAQALFKSLGWLDYSDETLKAVAKGEHDGWTHPKLKASVR
jgi:hypothetical protein